MERVWRHLNSCQSFTYLHAHVPRISCQMHGVLQVAVRWDEARGRFTKLFERLAIDGLKSWDEFWLTSSGSVRARLGEFVARACPKKETRMDSSLFIFPIFRKN